MLEYWSIERDPLFYTTIITFISGLELKKFLRRGLALFDIFPFTNNETSI